MEKSLAAKMLEIQKLHLKFPKTTEGYNYKYVPLDELWDKLSPVLDDRGLLVSHKTENKEVVTKVVDTESGEHITSAMPLPDNLDPQKLGSAVTYFRRYNLLQLFNLMTDEDDDGNSAKQQPRKGGSEVKSQHSKSADESLEDLMQ